MPVWGATVSRLQPKPAAVLSAARATCAARLPRSDVDIVTLQNPFDHLHRDSDVEGMTDGFDPGTAYGEIYGIDDPSMVRRLGTAPHAPRLGRAPPAPRAAAPHAFHPSTSGCTCAGRAASGEAAAAHGQQRPACTTLRAQGWSRYAQGVRHMAFNSGLFYIRANPRTVDLLTRIAGAGGVGGVNVGGGGGGGGGAGGGRRGRLAGCESILAKTASLSCLRHRAQLSIPPTLLPALLQTS